MLLCFNHHIFIKMDLVKFVQDEFVTKNELPEFAAGDTITVYYEIKEGNKTRTQFFKGVVIQRRGSGSSETFTIRKMSGTVGVERIFPVNLPTIQKIEKISPRAVLDFTQPSSAGGKRDKLLIHKIPGFQCVCRSQMEHG